MPVSASDLINTTVNEISQKSSGGKLSFGLLTSLWFASSGMGAIIEGLNARAGDPEAKAAGEKLPDERARVRAAGAQSP